MEIATFLDFLHIRRWIRRCVELTVNSIINIIKYKFNRTQLQYDLIINVDTKYIILKYSRNTVRLTRCSVSKEKYSNAAQFFQSCLLWSSFGGPCATYLLLLLKPKVFCFYYWIIGESTQTLRLDENTYKGKILQ